MSFDVMQTDRCAAWAGRVLTILAALAALSAGASAQGGSVAPVPGDLAVSEIMFNPGTPVDDNDGEYFEVTNISTKILDLNGLYVQDLETAGSTSAPYFKIPAGALPNMYPGQTFLFARSGDSALNGALPIVHYVYSVPTGSPVPADKSKVSHTGMALSNSTVDAIAITSGAPQNAGGFIIEMVTYDPSQAPLTNNSGIGFERSNLMAPWQTSNIAAAVTPIAGSTQLGTPGFPNDNDTTLYPSWSRIDAPFPGLHDKGVLTAAGPCSAAQGSAHLKLKGPALQAYGVAFSPLPLTMPLLGGTLLIDIWNADIWAPQSFVLDAQGKADLMVPLGNAPIGTQAYVQWFSYDGATGDWTFSNALGVDVGP